MAIDFNIKFSALLGQTGNYIVIRVAQQHISHCDNFEVKSVEIDALQLLRKDDKGEWKFRSS